MRASSVLDTCAPLQHPGEPVMPFILNSAKVAPGPAAVGEVDILDAPINNVAFLNCNDAGSASRRSAATRHCHGTASVCYNLRILLTRFSVSKALGPICLNQGTGRLAEQRCRLAGFENLRAHKRAVDEYRELAGK